MPMGAYSVVRYSNNLNDQRVNLGVLVWHPLDGFTVRFAPTMGRVHAINPTVDLRELEDLLYAIEHDLAAMREKGSEALSLLSHRYRDGVEVGLPYPAKISSLGSAANRLFEMLITPKGEVHRTPQAEFQQAFTQAVKSAVKELAQGFKLNEHGRKRVNGVDIDLGLEIKAGKTTALWHSLALFFSSNPSAQIAKAKGAAFEYLMIRDELPDYKGARQLVAVQARGGVAEHRDAVKAWLGHSPAEVVMVEGAGELQESIKSKLLELKR